MKPRPRHSYSKLREVLVTNIMENQPAVWQTFVPYDAAFANWTAQDLSQNEKDDMLRQVQQGVDNALAGAQSLGAPLLLLAAVPAQGCDPSANRWAGGQGCVETAHQAVQRVSLRRPTGSVLLFHRHAQLPSVFSPAMLRCSDCAEGAVRTACRRRIPTKSVLLH